MGDKFWMRIASKLPKKLVYFCSVRLMANAIGRKWGQQIASELTAVDALKRW